MTPITLRESLLQNVHFPRYEPNRVHFNLPEEDSTYTDQIIHTENNEADNQDLLVSSKFNMGLGANGLYAYISTTKAYNYEEKTPFQAISERSFDPDKDLTSSEKREYYSHLGCSKKIFGLDFSLEDWNLRKQRRETLTDDTIIRKGVSKKRFGRFEAKKSCLQLDGLLVHAHLENWIRDSTDDEVQKLLRNEGQLDVSLYFNQLQKIFRGKGYSEILQSVSDILKTHIIDHAPLTFIPQGINILLIDEYCPVADQCDIELFNIHRNL